MSITTPVSYDFYMAQVMENEDDPSVPAGRIRLTAQGPDGQVQLIVADPTTVEEIRAVWTPYKDANDAAAADLTGQTPYPDPPMYQIVLSQS
jgi:hypothetical protein